MKKIFFLILLLSSSVCANNMATEVAEKVEYSVTTVSDEDFDFTIYNRINTRVLDVIAKSKKSPYALEARALFNLETGKCDDITFSRTSKPAQFKHVSNSKVTVRMSNEDNSCQLLLERVHDALEQNHG